MRVGRAVPVANPPILAGMAAPHAPAGETAGAAGSDQTLYGSRAIRDLYPGLREDRLRYLERWGVIRPVRVTGGERFYAFADLAALRHASAELAKGIPFRTVVRDLRTMRQRQLEATQGAQLSFDFTSAREATPAKVIALGPRVAPVEPPAEDSPRSEVADRLPPSAMPAATLPQRLARAATLFAEAAAIQDTLPYMEPPFWYYPVQQSLGAALLQAGHVDEAEQAFAASLTRARNNGWALFGLMKVHEARGDREAAKEAAANLERAWAGDTGMLDLARL